jgi:hypothetical protein
MPTWEDTMSPASFDLAAAVHAAETSGPCAGGKPLLERTPRRRSWLAELLFTPFEDIDERVRVKG